MSATQSFMRLSLRGKGRRKEGRGKGEEKEEEGGARSGRELQLPFRVTVHSLAYGLMPQFLSTSFLRARDTFRTKLSSSNSSRNWEEHSNYSSVHAHQPQLEHSPSSRLVQRFLQKTHCVAVYLAQAAVPCTGGMFVCGGRKGRVCVWKKGRVCGEDMVSSIALGLTGPRDDQSHPAAGP